MLILERVPELKPSRTTKITPAIKNLKESAQETLVHVTAATLTDLQLKLGIKFSYLISCQNI